MQRNANATYVIRRRARHPYWVAIALGRSYGRTQAFATWADVTGVDMAA